MPFKVTWNEDIESIIVVDMIEDFSEAAELVEEIRDPFQENGDFIAANWHPLLVEMVCMRQEHRAIHRDGTFGIGLIPAIKLYREITGAYLKEAKDYIEGLIAGNPLPKGDEWPRIARGPAVPAHRGSAARLRSARRRRNLDGRCAIDAGVAALCRTARH